jgi:DNA-binding MarR family transcriptional regulator
LASVVIRSYQQKFPWKLDIRTTPWEGWSSSAPRMRRRGLVKVTVDPADKRSRLMSLTSAGRNLLARAVPIWQRTHAEIEGLLAEGGPELLRGNLRALA